MPTFYGNPRIHFGTGYSQSLPAGWELIESPEDWARARSPLGTEYYLGEGLAYPMKIADELDEIRTGGKLRVGTRFMTDEEPIRLNAETR